MTCVDCGAELARAHPWGRWPKRCDRCKRAPAPNSANCCVCGVALDKPERGPWPLRCPTCRNVHRNALYRGYGRSARRRARGLDIPSDIAIRLEIRICRGCGNTFRPQTDKQVFCNRECRHATHALSQREAPSKRRPFECKACGSTVFPSRRGRRSCYCSDECALRGRSEKRRVACYIRRAIKSGATAEPVKAEDVFERDGWRCGICRRKVNKNLKWPHPMSASLDHIIPLVKGGTHGCVNVQLAHLRCNLSKHTRPMGEQLLLVG